MRTFLTIILTLFLIGTALAQMPSEQYMLYKAWADSAFRAQGCGDYVFSLRDTVVLEGSDVDTVQFNIPDARGYFTVWVIPDTANFAVGGVEHDHAIGASDSLSLSFKPQMNDSTITGNSATDVSEIDNLDWDAEAGYYGIVNPPITEYLEFYLEHTGAADTSAVIIELQWQ